MSVLLSGVCVVEIKQTKASMIVFLKREAVCNPDFLVSDRHSQECEILLCRYSTADFCAVFGILSWAARLMCKTAVHCGSSRRISLRSTSASKTQITAVGQKTKH